MPLDTSHNLAFRDRHVGLAAVEVDATLSAIGVDGLDDLADAVPSESRATRPLQHPTLPSGAKVLNALRRTRFENPAGYTSNIPHQPEMSLGRLDRPRECRTATAVGMRPLVAGKLFGGVWRLPQRTVVHRQHCGRHLHHLTVDRTFRRFHREGAIDGERQPSGVTSWPPVGPVDQVSGGRNVLCECLFLEVRLAPTGPQLDEAHA